VRDDRDIFRDTSKSKCWMHTVLKGLVIAIAYLSVYVIAITVIVITLSKAD